MLIFGIIFLIAALLNIDLKILTNPFLGNQEVSQKVLSYISWFYGEYAAVTVTFGLFIIFIIRSGFKRKERGAWISLFIPFTAWFIIVTLNSIVYQANVILVGNSLFYFLLILPLIFTKKIFRKQETMGS